MNAATRTARVLGCAAALAGLPGMGPRRLTALLDAWGAEEAWARATSGQRPRLEADAEVARLLGPTERARTKVVSAWADHARTDPLAVAAGHRAQGVEVLLRDDPGYPPALAADIEPPAVLFARGDLDALDARRAAIVGTRRCTGVGAGFARELGAQLAEASVVVVSGLALGIDGAAHRGVLDAHRDGAVAPPVGVVGCGLDVAYPARHRSLQDQVGEIGLLLSESPLGQRPAGWRFPARNRIIAALAEVVVVVESHLGGGSLHTVTEAQRRDIPVLAVPGSVRNPAAAGTNRLIADGCHPVCDSQDVVLALGLSTARRHRSDPRPAPDAAARVVLAAFDWEPATLEHLVVRTGLALGEVSVALAWLQDHGWVRADGGWYERVARR